MTWIDRARRAGGAAAVVATVLIPSAARGQTNQLFATGPTVNVRFFGSFAGFRNQLFWCDAVGSCGQLLFDPFVDAPGVVKTVNHTFSVNQEVIFGLFVTNTGNWWYTGPASRNADGVGHFQTSLSGDQAFPIRGGFEDQFGGGDQDYNDIMFDFQSVSQIPNVTPEPAPLVLLGTGVLAVAMRRRARRLANSEKTDDRDG